MYNYSNSTTLNKTHAIAIVPTAPKENDTSDNSYEIQISSSTMLLFSIMVLTSSYHNIINNYQLSLALPTIP